LMEKKELIAGAFKTRTAAPNITLYIYLGQVRWGLGVREGGKGERSGKRER
jgi:hypothetical protein